MAFARSGVQHPLALLVAQKGWWRSLGGGDRALWMCWFDLAGDRAREPKTLIVAIMTKRQSPPFCCFSFSLATVARRSNAIRPNKRRI
jgi:hypothetical protein